VCEPRADRRLPLKSALGLAVAFQAALDLLEQGARTVNLTTFERLGAIPSLRRRTTLRTMRPAEPPGNLTLATP